MKNNPLPHLDSDTTLRNQLIRHCRIGPGQIWVDPISGHKVGCLDAGDSSAISSLMSGAKATLAIQDPPYNVAAFEIRDVRKFVDWSRRWVSNTLASLGDNSSLYIWIGADQNDRFQPLPDLMLMMRDFPVKSRSFITMRNQRGYGTQNNWMAVRQELLYYVVGEPLFNVKAEYTDIPKILRGYYKEVGGQRTENIERSKSENIRAGNVWVDVQQVFYRMEENVSGCYAQKPLKSIQRIVEASSNSGDIVVDFFSHSGTSLLACEVLKRKCFTTDVDPIYCEITIRRLEQYRKNGRLGWQNGHPFEKELPNMPKDVIADEDLRDPNLQQQRSLL